MASKLEKLITLEERVSNIEKMIYSDDPRYHDQEKVVPRLVRISEKVNSAKNSSNNLKKIYAQLDELQRAAAMCHASTVEPPVDAKIDFIEASEKQLNSQAKQLESVDKLKWVLDSEHLKSRVTSDLNSRLLHLAHLHSEDREEADTSIAQANEMIETYNKAISSISRQFEQWNAVVTKLEEQHNATLD